MNGVERDMGTKAHNDALGPWTNHTKAVMCLHSTWSQVRTFCEGCTRQTQLESCPGKSSASGRWMLTLCDLTSLWLKCSRRVGEVVRPWNRGHLCRPVASKPGPACLCISACIPTHHHILGVDMPLHHTNTPWITSPQATSPAISTPWWRYDGYSS
jgi:hypothetical protein